MSPAKVDIPHPRIGITSITVCENKSLMDTLKTFPFGEIRTNLEKYPLGGEDLMSFLKGLDGAIIGRDRIDSAIISRLPDLKVISKFGVGMDNIDTAACRDRGVAVLHSEGVNRRSVAEMTLGFMIFLIRNLFRTSVQLKGGHWHKDGGRQLSGKVIGIIGVGNVGQDLVHLLRPFSCKILANDIADRSDFYRSNHLIDSSKERIFKESDIVTIHTPLTEKTRGMVNRDVLSRMKKDAFLINTARGAIVVEDDLKRALEKEMIAGAAVDVYGVEPAEDGTFLRHKNLICTPHIGGNAREAVISMGEAAISNLVRFWGFE